MAPSQKTYEFSFPGTTTSQPSVAYNPSDSSFSIAFIGYDYLEMPPAPPIETYSVYVYKVSDDYLELVDSQTNEMRSPALAIAEDGIQLVVWQYDNGSDWDVYGHMLNSDGTTSGTVIGIADNSDNEMMPDVAWSESAEAFLVVWHNNGGFIPQGVQGRRVLDDGTLTGSIVLYSDTNTTSYPAVTATPTDWWIVWQQGTPTVLYGQQVLSNGTKEGDNTLFFASNDNRTKPALTGGNVDGTMLLAWEDDRDSEDTIYHAVINTGSVTTTTIAYTYDPLYRLVEADYSGNITAHYQYVYDAVGNMRDYTETVGIELVRVRRNFDRANQLQTSTMLDGPELGTTSYYFDNNGNLEMMILPGTPTVVLTYDYNQRNLLVETARQIGHGPTVPTAAFSYDGLGNRVQQVDLTGSTPITTTYANDNLGLSQVLVAYSANEETSNLFGLDLILQDTGANTLTLLTDGLGSVRLELIEDTIKTTTTYDPYGNQLTHAGTSNTTYGFTGEQEDSSTGLLYLRARYYNSSLRNFMVRDPWIGQPNMPSTLHGYSYTHNNPVNYVDPTGLRRIAPECSGGGDLFSSYSVSNYQGYPYYIMVNYQHEPWSCYKSEHAPYHTVLVPVRHPLNLLEENPNCASSLEVAKAFYASGAFTMWEVNARNIMAEINGVISSQKEWALRDAIGIAYVPYNRIEFNSLPEEMRYTGDYSDPTKPEGGASFSSYGNRSDALGKLLDGDGQFAAISTAGYTDAMNPDFAYKKEVYHFALAVTYGVHSQYLRDTSYGTTGYRHRPQYCTANDIYYSYTFFENQTGKYFWLNSWRPTSAELEASGGWSKWTDSDRYRQIAWETPYPPEGCDFPR